MTLALLPTSLAALLGVLAQPLRRHRTALLGSGVVALAVGVVMATRRGGAGMISPDAAADLRAERRFDLVAALLIGVIAMLAAVLAVIQIETAQASGRAQVEAARLTADLSARLEVSTTAQDQVCRRAAGGPGAGDPGHGPRDRRAAAQRRRVDRGRPGGAPGCEPISAAPWPPRPPRAAARRSTPTPPAC